MPTKKGKQICFRAMFAKKPFSANIGITEWAVAMLATAHFWHLTLSLFRDLWSKKLENAIFDNFLLLKVQVLMTKESYDNFAKMPCSVRDFWPITVLFPCLGHPMTYPQERGSKFTSHFSKLTGTGSNFPRKYQRIPRNYYQCWS